MHNSVNKTLKQQKRDYYVYYSAYTQAKWTLSDTEGAASTAVNLLTEFRKKALPLIHVPHEFPSDEPPFFLLGSEGAKIHSSVLPIEAEHIVLKHNINSFRDAELQKTLIDLNLDKLIIVAVCVLILLLARQ